MFRLNQLKTIAIFCGSSMGFDPCYRHAVEQVARVLVEKQITIVYGGATVGLMGVLADTALACGGKANVISSKVCMKEKP
jgi:predicted Rossmann-fold nucleotide-binding protein